MLQLGRYIRKQWQSKSKGGGWTDYAPKRSLKYPTLLYRCRSEQSKTCSATTHRSSIQWDRGREVMLCLAELRQTAFWGVRYFEKSLRNIRVKKILPSDFLLHKTSLSCFLTLHPVCDGCVVCGPSCSPHSSKKERIKKKYTIFSNLL